MHSSPLNKKFSNKKNANDTSQLCHIIYQLLQELIIYIFTLTAIWYQWCPVNITISSGDLLGLAQWTCSCIKAYEIRIHKSWQPVDSCFLTLNKGKTTSILPFLSLSFTFLPFSLSLTSLPLSFILSLNFYIYTFLS